MGIEVHCGKAIGALSFVNQLEASNSKRQHQIRARSHFHILLLVVMRVFLDDNTVTGMYQRVARSLPIGVVSTKGQ